MVTHLREDRLFDCYLAQRQGDAPDSRAAAHLATCATCANRFDELTRFLDGLREAGDAEFDALFSAEHLRDQQRQIAKRLELVGRSARVLSFPRQTTGLSRPARRVFPRWVAATAAAGVVAGMAAGMFLERTGRRGPGAGQTMAGRPQHLPSAATTHDLGTDLERQATFLSEIDLAVDSPRTAELAAYDELTPHVREVSLTILDR